MNTGSTATSTVAGKTKTALWVQATGPWTGSGSECRAIFARASGGPADANYGGFFKAGDVVLEDGRLGAQVLKPTAKVHVAAGSAVAGTAAFKLNSLSGYTAVAVTNLRVARGSTSHGHGQDCRGTPRQAEG